MEAMTKRMLNVCISYVLRSQLLVLPNPQPLGGKGGISNFPFMTFASQPSACKICNVYPITPGSRARIHTAGLLLLSSPSLSTKRPKRLVRQGRRRRRSIQRRGAHHSTTTAATAATVTLVPARVPHSPAPHVGRVGAKGTDVYVGDVLRRGHVHAAAVQHVVARVTTKRAC